MTKEERQAELLEWSDSYYNKSISLVPDNVYDAKYGSFAEDFPNDPFLKTIGSRPDPASEWEKAEHKIPMGSLNKVTDENEFNKWMQNSNVKEIVASEKLDGISIDLEYESGKLIKAITRGDGFIGENITKNVVRMQNVVSDFGKRFSITGRENYTITARTFVGSIRGEIILKQNDFDSIVAIQKERGEKPLKNLRNGASGIAKRYDGKYSEYLSIVYFDITGEFDTKYEKFLAIEKLGLPTSLVQLYYSKEHVIEIYEKYEQNKRASLDYEIDGLVLDVNDINHFNELGEVNKRPKGAVAYKFTSMKKETKIRGITWQLGNSGTITPVAELEPVGIGGVTVTRATLHNFKKFKVLKLSAGSDVLVSRRGDVTPYVEKVVSYQRGSLPFEPIKECPVCKSIPVVNGKFLECPNPMCDGAKIGDLKKWMIKTGMRSEGIGDKTIEKLYNVDYLIEPADFYVIKVEDIQRLEGFGKRSAQKFVDIVNDHKELTLPEFIGGLNIKNFSSSMVELLVENGYDTLQKISYLMLEKLIKVKGIEEKTAKAFLVGFELKREIMSNLFDVGVKIKEKEVMETNTNGKLSGLSFCFTGKVEASNEDGERYTRSMLQDLVMANGGDNFNSVKSGLVYLVQADPSSQSTKTKKAIGFGVEIISDIKFLEMVK